MKKVELYVTDDGSEFKEYRLAKEHCNKQIRAKIAELASDIEASTHSIEYCLGTNNAMELYKDISRLLDDRDEVL